MGLGGLLLGLPSVFAPRRATDPRPSVGTPVPQDPTFPPLPERLSETGLYGSGNTREVVPEALPYTPQYPLWTDGAAKNRWLLLPPGGTIDASDPDRWRFPVGTRFFKEFRFRTGCETRMIEKLSDEGFRYATYIWDARREDAILAPRAGVPAFEEVAPGIFHDVPGESDCRACHEGRTSPILGFGALQLSWDRDPLAVHGEAPSAPLPSPGTVDLRDLITRGLLRGHPPAWSETAPRIAAPSATARAAAGYLFGNCAGCHNGEGPLAELGLTFDHSVSDPQSYHRVRQSLLTQTTHFRLPGAVSSARVHPGSPKQSALAFRMRSRDPMTQMPPLGTRLVDTEGAALIERWIAGNLL